MEKDTLTIITLLLTFGFMVSFWAMVFFILIDFIFTGTLLAIHILQAVGLYLGYKYTKAVESIIKE